MIIKSAQDIGKLAKEARKKQNFTQVQLAQLSNVGTRFLSDLENGKPTCEIDKVIKVFLRENIELKSGAYNYNEYSLLINNSEDIMQDIESNFDIYLAQAKENENTLKKSMKIDNLKNSLASTDYQIIKCVESYMIDSILPYDFASLLYDRMSWRDEINSIQADSLTIDSTLEQEKTKKNESSN